MDYFYEVTTVVQVILLLGISFQIRALHTALTGKGYEPKYKIKKCDDWDKQKS